MFRLPARISDGFLRNGEGEERKRTVSVVSVASVSGRSVDVLDSTPNRDGAVFEVLDRSDGLREEDVSGCQGKGGGRVAFSYHKMLFSYRVFSFFETIPLRRSSQPMLESWTTLLVASALASVRHQRSTLIIASTVTTHRHIIRAFR